MDGSIRPGASQSVSQRSAVQCKANQPQTWPAFSRCYAVLLLCGITVSSPSPLFRHTLPNPADKPAEPPSWRNTAAGALPTAVSCVGYVRMCVHSHCGFRPPTLRVISTHLHSTIAASRPNTICARMEIQRNNLLHTHCLTEHVSQYRMSDASNPETGAQSVLLHQIPEHGDSQKKEASIPWE